MSSLHASSRWEEAKAKYLQSYRRKEKDVEPLYIMAVANSKRAQDALITASKFGLIPLITRDKKGKPFTVRVEVREVVGRELYQLGWNLVHGGVTAKGKVTPPKKMKMPEDAGSSVRTVVGGIPSLGKKR